MKSFLTNQKISTYLKYFLSYLIIFTVLVLGFFFILKIQITEKYFETKKEQAQLQLDNLAAHLNDDILFLTQLDSSIASNQTILDLNYHTKKSQLYTVRTELMQYISTSRLLHSAVFMSRTTQNLLSTMFLVEYADGIFLIKSTTDSDIYFDPTSYYNNSTGQLIFIQDDQNDLLIYFPVNHFNASYVYFYIMDTQHLQMQLKSLVSSELPAIALVDNHGNIVTGIETELLIPYINDLKISYGLHKQDDNTSICVSSSINNGYYIISMLSNNLLSEQISSAFAATYFTFLLLSIGVFFLIPFSMKLTYGPLHQLVKTVIPDYDTKQSYVKQLNLAFTEASEQNLRMQEKLDNYRRSIQKSLLDSVLLPQYQNASALPDIDQLFDGNSQDREIFILKTNLIQKSGALEHIIKCFQEFLSGNGDCILLETAEDTSTLLIIFTGEIPDKGKTLNDFCHTLYTQYGHLFAISNSASSPLDIPSLYENAVRASAYWSKTPIADYHALASFPTTYAYPHDVLELMSKNLKANNFSAARKLIYDIFTELNAYASPEHTIPAFFINCVLIDMLTIIANNMNLAYINFRSYSDMYFNILYLCRSFPYVNKKEEIMHHTNELLNFYENTITSKLLNTAPIKRFMEDNYHNPEFSISILAEHYHVSVSRMSVLFKNELNIGFADYLWLLRANKAKKLLKDSDMSIDEISIAVGYLNTSSFRRKFKHETGLSPSQYRAEFSNEAPD